MLAVLAPSIGSQRDTFDNVLTGDYLGPSLPVSRQQVHAPFDRRIASRAGYYNHYCCGSYSDRHR
jgi:hypothetical protein